MWCFFLFLKLLFLQTYVILKKKKTENFWGPAWGMDVSEGGIKPCHGKQNKRKEIPLPSYGISILRPGKLALPERLPLIQDFIFTQTISVCHFNCVITQLFQNHLFEKLLLFI